MSQQSHKKQYGIVHIGEGPTALKTGEVTNTEKKFREYKHRLDIPNVWRSKKQSPKG
jgi:hypothetical protein